MEFLDIKPCNRSKKKLQVELKSKGCYRKETSTYSIVLSYLKKHISFFPSPLTIYFTWSTILFSPPPQTPLLSGLFIKYCDVLVILEQLIFTKSLTFMFHH